jgi:molecular chaperone DnaJ
VPDPIPTDNLYERLGVGPDAEHRAIERAWRALLKQHHPDVAGVDSLEAAKQINVAHDWLADPVRRARYDEATRRRARGEGGRVRAGVPPERPSRATAAASRPRRRAEDEPDHHDGLDAAFGVAAAGVRAFLRQIDRLTADDLDRLSVSSPHAPTRSLRRFVPPELWARVDAIDRLIGERLPRRARADATALAAARSFGHALVLEAFMALHFQEPDELIELMRRGWESSVGQPRYGPNGREVRTLIERFRRTTREEAIALVDAWGSDLAGEDPWPADAWQYDYAALEVSAAVARRDAADAPNLIWADDAAERDRLRAAFARSAHVVALRPIFSPREYARLRLPSSALGQPERDPLPTATVRRA